MTNEFYVLPLILTHAPFLSCLAEVARSCGSMWEESDSGLLLIPDFGENVSVSPLGL